MGEGARGIKLIRMLVIFHHPVLIIQSVQGGKVSILGGHNIGHSTKNSVYAHVCYSEQFPR
jgi:hypothetical protein